jgi:NADP-dependent aldehyde dehydrogenase
MRPSGTAWVGGEEPEPRSARQFRAVDPRRGEALAPDFHEASTEQIAHAVGAAARAFESYANRTGSERAAFLRAAAAGLEALGDELIDRASAETGLPRERLLAERGRTCGQLRLFAATIEEGSCVEARIDRALPERKPLARPDVRRMLIPLGPVAVFGAANFPLAFSAAGGDTASALAAGCPVIVKGHPAHPGTSELVARALLEAARRTGLPPGVFSLLQGASHQVGLELVRQPALRAVAFTGSHAGGRALFDEAARRDEPIPVFAEMGSANPLFVLPRALARRGEEIARALAASVSLGVGQFCTNPGITVLCGNEGEERFLATLSEALAATPSAPMLHAGIRDAYEAALMAAQQLDGVRLAVRAPQAADPAGTSGRSALLVTQAEDFLRHPGLGVEIFGPVTVAVRGGSRLDCERIARGLRGHLTATVHGDEDDLVEFAALFSLLRHRVGRLIVNGFPTGVEVAPAMQHGGPYPATTDSRSTSVGTAAMQRFARPVCFQDAPDALLPAELRRANPLGIWRWVGDTYSKEPA